jgi:PTS system mannose-specific IIA component
MIGCIILTHADLGFGLKNALEGIMGKQEGLSVLSNTGLGKEEMISALQRKMDEENYDGGVAIFVDMPGTSWWQTAKKVTSGMLEHRDSNPWDRPKIAVITGVNLPMLVKFFTMRKSLPLSQLIPLIKLEGEKGIITES